MYQAHLMTWRSADGKEATTRFLDTGPSIDTGIPIVFIHGVGMSLSFWEGQIAHFAQSRRVVVFDILGHGKSSLPTENGDLTEYSAQMKALLDHLDLARVDLVGHSMGGLVAIEFALAFPQRVSRLVVMNSVYCRSGQQREAVVSRARAMSDGAIVSGIDETLARWFGDPIPAKIAPIAEQARKFLLAADPDGYSRTYLIFATSDRRYEEGLAELAMPTLFVTGEFDSNSTPAMSIAMAAKAPLGKARIIPGQRHMMMLVAPEIVNAELDEFFAKS